MKIHCEGCGKALKIPDSRAGKRVLCPCCKTVFRASVLKTLEASQTAPPAPPALPLRPPAPSYLTLSEAATIIPAQLSVPSASYLDKSLEEPQARPLPAELPARCVNPADAVPLTPLELTPPPSTYLKKPVEEPPPQPNNPVPSVASPVPSPRTSLNQRQLSPSVKNLGARDNTETEPSEIRGPVRVLPQAHDVPPIAPPTPNEEFGVKITRRDERDNQRQIAAKPLGDTLKTGAAWLLGSGIFFALNVIFNVLSTSFFVQRPLAGANALPYPIELAGRILVLCIPSLIMGIAAWRLRWGKSRSLVVTGIVFDFLLCVYLLFRFLNNARGLSQISGPLYMMVLSQMALASGSIALGLYAGIKTLNLLNRHEIKVAFAPSRLPREDVEAGPEFYEWERQRHERRRHGGAYG